MPATNIQCPKCGSEQITAQKKGFSGTKAVGGALLTGGIGLLAGLHGSSDIQVSCLNCGQSWNPNQLAEQRGKEATLKQTAEANQWKQDFYKAYRKKDYAKAEEVYTSRFAFSTSIPDVHKAFKESRKIDLIGAFVVIGLSAAFIWLFVWILS